MTDLATAAIDRIRRSLSQEFVQMEDDFDKTRDLRTEITDRLMSGVRRIELFSADGKMSDDIELQLKVINTGLKALSDTEKAKSTAIVLKLKQNEQAMASAAEARDRLEIVFKATAPGRIEDGIDIEDMGKHIASMFDGDIEDFELKKDNSDLSES